MTTHIRPAGCDLDSLEAIEQAATPGPWLWWTSNSFMRLSARGDGDVAHGARLHDGVCTITIKQADADFIVAARAAMPALIAAARAARAPQGDTRHGADREISELARAGQSPVAISNAELAAFHRFCDCCEDFGAGGHDVPKAMMSQLVRIGLVRPAGPGRHETTKFGDWLRDHATPAAHTCTPADERAVDMPTWQELYRRSSHKPFYTRSQAKEDEVTMLRAALTRAAQGAGTAPVVDIAELGAVLEMARQSLRMGRNEKARGHVGHAIFLLTRAAATHPAPVSTAAANQRVRDYEAGVQQGVAEERAARFAHECAQLASNPDPQQRVRFEAAHPNLPHDKIEGDYVSSDTRDAWDTWKLALDSAAAAPDKTCQRCSGHEVIYVDNTQQPCPTCQDLSDYDEISPTDTGSGAESTAAATTASASRSHHLTPENIAATIKDLREIEDGTTERPIAVRDYRTWAGVLARIMEHLTSRAADGQQGASRAALDDETMDRLHKLRQEVAMMYMLLDGGEWAEHLAVTPEGQCLETAITKLVGKANAALARNLPAQGAAQVEAARDAVLEEAANVCKPGLIDAATAYEIAAIRKCAEAIRVLKSDRAALAAKREGAK